MKILLKDLALPQTIPFSRFRTIFSFRDGIYTTIERVKIIHGCNKEIELYFSHPNKKYQNIVAYTDGLIPVSGNMQDSDFDLIIDSSTIDTLSIFQKIENNIIEDLKITDKSRFLSSVEFEQKFPNVEVLGDRELLYVAGDVDITSRNVIFDTRQGVIIVDSGTVISPFTIISGVTYIGCNSDIVNARISYNTIIGNRCRVSGEVSSVIFNDFAYKSHDGFLGQTILGVWVNLGAMTTTSNLKNNFSTISLLLPITSENMAEKNITSTESMKFGSFIGDYSKTAIGTMINCGTVLDSGSNVILQSMEKYIYPLSWIDNSTKYEKNRFIKDCEYILSRKGVSLPIGFAELVDLI